MRYRSLVWRLGAAEAGPIQTNPFHKLYPVLGWEAQDNWDYSVTPWSILNTHKPHGAWEGRWAKATFQTLGQPPPGPSEPAKEQKQSVWLGHPGRWFSLHIHYLLLPTPPIPPASVVAQHCIWQSRAGLQHLRCPPEPGIRLISQASHFGLLFLAQPHLLTLTESY